MIDVIICACVGALIFEAVLAGVGIIEKIPAVKRFVDARLAKYPDDEEEW